MDVPPPPGPPPLLNAAQIHQLCTEGFVGLDDNFGQRPYLAEQFESLRAAADAFFALPTAEKDPYKPAAKLGPPCRPDSTERGYTRLPGEKEYLTLRRSLSFLPPTDGLPDRAAQLWRDVARLLHRVLADIGLYLGLSPTAWDAVVADSLEPGSSNDPSNDPRNDPPTLLRLFRYEPGGAGAEQHCDLGLLTLCVCWGKGLQVRPGADPEAPWIDAPRITIMTGDTLYVLSLRRIPSAHHRVIVDDEEVAPDAPTSSPFSPPGRRSIVFALRSTTVGDIDLIPFGLEGSIGAMEIYDAIRKQRVNINADKDTRTAMRQQFRGMSG